MKWAENPAPRITVDKGTWSCLNRVQAIKISHYYWGLISSAGMGDNKCPSVGCDHEDAVSMAHLWEAADFPQRAGVRINLLSIPKYEGFILERQDLSESRVENSHFVVIHIIQYSDCFYFLMGWEHGAVCRAWSRIQWIYSFTTFENHHVCVCSTWN